MNSQQSLGGGARGFIPLKGRNVGVKSQFKPSPKYLSSLRSLRNFFPLPVRERVVASFTPAGEGLKGFTLAEVLITLGIIGVVAAMTMPTLVGKYQKQATVAKLQKIYSILNQAFQRSEVDNGDYRYWESGYDIGSDAYFDKYWKPYMQIIKVCKTASDCGYKTERWYLIDGTLGNSYIIANDLRTGVILKDGIFVSVTTKTIDSDGVSSPQTRIYVDINAGAGPNRIGKDVFSFYRVDDDTAKGVVADCYAASDSYIKNNCSLGSKNGNCCLQKIIRDGWQIKDDYPW